MQHTLILLFSNKLFLVQKCRISHPAGPTLANLNPVHSFLIYLSIPFYFVYHSELEQSSQQIHFQERDYIA